METWVVKVTKQDYKMVPVMKQVSVPEGTRLHTGE